MGFVFDFDAKNNVLRGTIEDRVTDAILLDFYATTGKYAASHLPCRGIMDFSKVTKFDVSNEAIRAVAAALPVFQPGNMRCLVCPADVIYGMARMFQILGEKTRSDLRVVRTLNEAYSLLGLESPEFSPISSPEP
jgi:hypothetical protein